MIFRVEQQVTNFNIAPDSARQALFHIVGAVAGEDVYLLSVLPGYFVVAHSTRPLVQKECRRVRDACHDVLEKFKLPVMRGIVPMSDEPRLDLMRRTGWQDDGIWRALRQNEDESWQDGILFSFMTGGQDDGILRSTDAENQEQTESDGEAERVRAGVTANPGPVLIDALASDVPGGPDFWPV